eukprot:gene8650-11693_t
MSLLFSFLYYMCQIWVVSYSLKLSPKGISFFSKPHSVKQLRSLYVNKDGFDGNEFENMLKSSGPIWNTQNDKNNQEIIEELRQKNLEIPTTSSDHEQIFREYPLEYTSIQLPILPDCNNYYSGKYKDYFWHQNSDQVYVFIPVLNQAIDRNNIKAKFEAKSVRISIDGQDPVYFECSERIIPDGSFWVLENDKNDNKYIQLDLEKRFRMINWKSLFEQPKEETSSDIDSNRSKMLEKLFAANKGMSRLTGKPAETMDEMMDNSDLVKRISNKIYGEPQVSTIDKQGNEVILNKDDISNIEDLENLEDFFKSGKDEIIDTSISEEK